MYYYPLQALKFTRVYYEQLYTNKLDNFNGMEKSLERHKSPKPTQKK